MDLGWQGKAETLRHLVIGMIAEGLPVEMISKVTKLTLEEIDLIWQNSLAKS